MAFLLPSSPAFVFAEVVAFANTHAILEWLGCIKRMALNSDTALDNLTRMVQVIQNDQKLREWFCELAHKSAVERSNEIYSVAERMRTEGKDADLAASFHLLADARVFDAARLAAAKLPTPKNISSRQTAS